MNVKRLQKSKFLRNKQLLFPQINCNLFKNIHTSNERLTKNYYEILEVDPKCSNKEIRLAYITLCKKFHPDLNQNEDRDGLIKGKFQDINKAYNCLIKDNERQAYDQYLKQKQYNQNTSFEYSQQNINNYNNYDRYYYNNYSSKHNYTEYDPRDYYERIRKQQYEQMFRRFDQRYYNNPYDNYYGVKGVQKVQNSAIVLICGFVMVCGFLLHYIQYRISIYRIKEMNEQWTINGLSYEQMKRKSLETSQEGRYQQLENLLKNVHSKDDNPSKTDSIK